MNYMYFNYATRSYLENMITITSSGVKIFHESYPLMYKIIFLDSCSKTKIAVV